MLSRSTVCAVIAFSFASIPIHADSLTTRDGVGDVTRLPIGRYR